MAIGTGANDRRIQRNSTLLANHQNYCTGSGPTTATRSSGSSCRPRATSPAWTARGRWAAYYVLNDAVHKADGTWHVVSRRLTHDFTVAKTETLDDKVVPTRRASSPTTAR